MADNNFASDSNEHWYIIYLLLAAWFMSSHDRTSSYVELLSSGKMSPPGKTSPCEMSSGGCWESWRPGVCSRAHVSCHEKVGSRIGSNQEDLRHPTSRYLADFLCSSKSSASAVSFNCEADVNDGGKEETCSTNDVRRMGKCEK